MPTVNSPAPTASGIAPSPATPQDGTQPVIHNGAGAPTNVPQSEEDYPEQRHAGAVGYGPDYAKGAGAGDKFAGIFEEAKGKVLRKPEVVEHGRERRTGELKEKEKAQADQSEDPFAKAGGEKPVKEDAPSKVPANKNATSQGPQDPADQHARERASTVAPEGTAKADVQRQGEAVNGYRNIG
ncbi:hypothetical protein B0H21DRAFT_776470 [Amylocystis lapponica]|nr:hypothetical protein B0H21DRAFT_776470 [Amylocystis lapponica]